MEEYERKQRALEEQRMLHLNKINIKVSVAGEPAVHMDMRGNVLFNKMRQIDENFDDIQDMVGEYFIN